MKKGIFFILLVNGIILQAAAGGGGAARGAAAEEDRRYLPSRIGIETVFEIFERTVFCLYEQYFNADNEHEAQKYDARFNIDKMLERFQHAFHGRMISEQSIEDLDRLNETDISFVQEKAFEDLTDDEKSLLYELLMRNAQESSYCFQRLDIFMDDEEYTDDMADFDLQRARFSTKQIELVVLPGMISFLRRALLPERGINRGFVMNAQDIRTLQAWYAIKARKRLLESLERAFAIGFHDSSSDVSSDLEDDVDEEGKYAEDEDDEDEGDELGQDNQVAPRDPNPENAD